MSLVHVAMCLGKWGGVTAATATVLVALLSTRWTLAWEDGRQKAVSLSGGNVTFQRT